MCPLQLWFKQRTWYLRAFCTVRKAERVFKLARIRALVLEETGFSSRGLQEKAPAVLSKEEAPGAFVLYDAGGQRVRLSGIR